MKIAIHQNKKVYHHSGGWDKEWVNYCEKNKLCYEFVDCYGLDAIQKLKSYDVLLWHFGNYSLQDTLFARSILYTVKSMGLKVFPDFNTAWHFDDKVAENFLLEAMGAPVPASWVFFTKNDAIEWLKTIARFPLVGKLRTGSGSNNIWLFNDKVKAISHVNRMFGKGYRNVPGVFFKTATNIKSTRDWKTFVNKAKRIPEFFRTYRRAKMLAPERGYAYFQEFIPNDGYDLKIAVVNQKLSFFARYVRKSDFRASGSADFFFDKSLVTPDIIKTAFETTKNLGFQCMGFDYVFDKQTKTGKIIETSFGFAHDAIMRAGGYWDTQGDWHDKPLNVPEEILKNLV